VSDLFAQFQNLIAALPEQERAGSIEMLLHQMEPSSAQLLRLCAIPHQFNTSIMQVLVPDLTTPKAEEHYAIFSKLSCVIPGPKHLALHDDARQYLFGQWLKTEVITEFASASLLLYRYFDKVAGQASGQALDTIKRRRMFHLLGAQQSKGFIEFELLFREARHQFRLNECENLLALCHEYDLVLAPELAVRLTYHEAKLAVDRLEWDRGKKLLDLVLKDQSATKEFRLKALHRLGFIYSELRDWDKSINQYNQALQLTQANEELADHIRSIYTSLGSAYRDSGKLKEAEDFFAASIQLSTKAEDLSAMASAWTSLGILHLIRRDNHQAVSAFQKSLDCLKRANDKFRRSRVYNNLGLAHGNLLEWENAKYFLESSLAISREAGDTLGQARTLNNLVRVFQNLKKFDEAIEHSQQAARLFTEVRDSYGIAQVKRNLGKLYRIMKQFDRASQAFTEAIDLFDRSNAPQDADSTRQELLALTQETRLPWWAWLTLVAFLLLALGFVVILILAIWGERLG
jgi:tetratricopeptide (TPR) repeat protein